MTAIQDEHDLIELSEQRHWLEELADIVVPCEGEPTPRVREVAATNLLANPLVQTHEFAWPHHDGLNEIRVRMTMIGWNLCCDSDESAVATYRVEVVSW